MILKSYALYLRRTLTARLLAVSIMFAFYLIVAGEPVDSLYIIYKNAPAPQKTRTANDIFNLLKNERLTDSLFSFQSKGKPETVDAHVHYWMAEHYYRRGQYDSSLEAGQNAISLMSHVKDDHFKSNVLGIVAKTQLWLCNYDAALETLIRVYKIDSGLKQPELISRDLTTMATLSLETKQPHEGLKFIEKAISIERNLNHPNLLSTQLGVACELYLMNNEPDKAIAAIDEAYQIDCQSGRKKKAAIRKSQKAAIFIAQHQLDKALQMVNEAMAILKQTNHTYAMAVCYNQLAEINHQLGNREKSLENYNKALEMSIKCGSTKVESRAERGLWENLRDSNPPVALLHLERYTALNDSLYSKYIATKLKNFDTSLSDAEYQVDDQPEGKKTFLYIAAALLAIMLMLMLIGLFSAWRKNKSALKLFKQSQDIKNRLLSNITKELQAPLTVILGAGERLVDEGRTSVEVNKRMGEMIIKHGNNMLHLVNRLLDIDTVANTTTGPDLKPGDIVMFMRLLVENYTDEALQKMINLEFISPLSSYHVIFAPDNLRKFAHILIDNAFKFTPRNGSVTVALDSIEHNKMRLVVQDTGKGIPASEMNRLFEPLSNQNYNDDGVSTGLDLSLAHQLISNINGSITVDSEPGSGTKFTVIFPVQQSLSQNNLDNEGTAQFVEKRIRQTGKSKQKQLVFIVENHDDIAFFIASILGQQYELRFARDGSEAFRNAQDLAPDLIITNIMMPVMDGKELMRKIKGNQSLKHTPIIALTSRSTEQERISCIQAGADAVLVKPFSSTELKLVAQRLIAQCTSIRELMAKTSSEANDTGVAAMSKEDKEFINRLISVIHAQMAKDDIDMEHIAAALSLSRKQLRSRVMSITGLTPVAYVLQVRLNYAHRMITTQDLSLTEIASKCGFQNLSHFSKTFKQQFGVSPMQFRKNIMDNISPPQAKT